MKSLSDLILEAEDQQNNNQNNGQNNNQNNDQNNDQDQQDNKNKSIKGDAGTFKQWPAFETTVKGWIKVMSGQEEAKDSFFDGGFLIPTTVAGCVTNTQAKVATLSKQLDSTCKVLITEFSSDFSFLLDGLKPYGYQSSGWSKTKGPKIADIIKSMKAEAKSSSNSEENKNNDNKDNGNSSNGGTM